MWAIRRKATGHLPQNDSITLKSPLAHLLVTQWIDRDLSLSCFYSNWSISILTYPDTRMNIPFCVWRNSITGEQKKPNWKPLTHLLRLEAGFSFTAAGTRGAVEGAMLSGGIILAQQTSTSIEGRAIKGKILNPRDVKHLTQSTRNWVSALTHRHDINIYILLQQQLQSEWKAE